MDKNKNLAKILIPILVVVCLLAGIMIFFVSGNYFQEETQPTQGMNGSILPDITVDPKPSIPLEEPDENVYSGQVVSLTIYPIEDDAKRDATMVTRATYDMIVNKTQNENGEWSDPIRVVYETNIDGSFAVVPGDTMYFSAIDNGQYDLDGTSVKSVTVKTMSRINDKNLDNGIMRGVYADGYMDVNTTTGEEAYTIYLRNFHYDPIDVTVAYTCYQNEKEVGSGTATVMLSDGNYPEAITVECDKEYDNVSYCLQYQMSKTEDQIANLVVRDSSKRDDDYIRVNLVNVSQKKVNAEVYVIFIKEATILDIVLAGNNDWSGSLKPEQKQYLYAYYPQEYYDDYLVCYNCEFAN